MIILIYVLYSPENISGLYFLSLNISSLFFDMIFRGGDLSMAFRTLEITNPTEIHIKNFQLELTQENQEPIYIPIEDIAQITTIGANIRLSTMDLSILSQNHVAITTLDEKYLPTAIVLPFEGNARQSQLIHQQVDYPSGKYQDLWLQIIKQKISNQSRGLSILGFDGAERIASYAEALTIENVDYSESIAAKEYFSYYHEGLNRRGDDPVNSRLNYGYAVVRSAIARSIVSVGCHPAFGVHHNNQLNAFNLADDLIEPFRAIVDLVAHDNIGPNEKLTKTERYNLAHVLHNACIVDGIKVNLLSAIELMSESYKRILMHESDEQLALPVILPVESMEGISI